MGEVCSRKGKGWILKIVDFGKGYSFQLWGIFWGVQQLVFRGNI